jgi:2-polyprenyl-3-methyl-5-hydroxy-6-metoxy-1,4-benzoquinol methylase
MQEFDDPTGTWPSEGAYRRLLKRTAKLLRRIEGLLGRSKNGIHLLDVGCSSGAFLSAAASLGVRVEGVEPAARPAETAIKMGLNVHHGLLQDLALPENAFDVITLFEVIEHLKDPLTLLRACLHVLRPEGLLVIRTGNTDSWTAQVLRARWEYFHLKRHGGHICFYSPASIKSLAERTGFAVERLTTHAVSFYQREEVPWILYRPAKILSELLNSPSTWLGKGHEMIVFLRM